MNTSISPHDFNFIDAVQHATVLTDKDELEQTHLVTELQALPDGAVIDERHKLRARLKAYFERQVTIAEEEEERDRGLLQGLQAQTFDKGQDPVALDREAYLQTIVKEDEEEMKGAKAELEGFMKEGRKNDQSAEKSQRGKEAEQIKRLQHGLKKRGKDDKPHRGDSRAHAA